MQDGETVFVRTAANSGKVKCIRHNGQVNIARCKVDGPVGRLGSSNGVRGEQEGEIYEMIREMYKSTNSETIISEKC